MGMEIIVFAWEVRIYLSILLYAKVERWVGDIKMILTLDL